MSLTPSQQLQKLFDASQHILILLPADPQGDAIASAWAFALFLRRQSKTVTVAAEGVLSAANRYTFLSQPDNLTESLAGSRDFVLSFNTRYNKIVRVRSEENVEEYRIYITPEHGSIDPRDFSFIPAKFKFDAVMVFGAPDKEALGKLYETNADIFYEVPIVNVDHHPKNENFGQINFVDITASSTSEIVTALLETIDADALDAPVAECLLTGIISATDSFQKKNTTPKALQTASHLMDKGADQQKIVRNLYKTQPLHLLKLWGRVMAEMRWNESLRLVWAPVAQTDLRESQAKVEDLPYILEKIRCHYSAGAFFLLLFQENPSSLRGILKTTSSEAFAIIETMWPEGKLKNDAFEFPLASSSIEMAEREITERLRKFLAPQ